MNASKEELLPCICAKRPALTPASSTHKTVFVGSAIDPAGGAPGGEGKEMLVRIRPYAEFCDHCGGRWNGVKLWAAGRKSVHVQEEAKK